MCKCGEKIKQCEICRYTLYCNYKCRSINKKKLKLGHLCDKCEYCIENKPNPNKGKNKEKKKELYRYQEVNKSEINYNVTHVGVGKKTCKDKCVIF